MLGLTQLCCFDVSADKVRVATAGQTAVIIVVGFSIVLVVIADFLATEPAGIYGYFFVSD